MKRTEQIQLRGDKKDKNKKGKGKGDRKGQGKKKAGKGKGSTKALTRNPPEECEGHEEEAREDDDELGDEHDMGQEEKDKKVEAKVEADEPGDDEPAAKTPGKNRGAGRKPKCSGKGKAKAKVKKTRRCKKQKRTAAGSPMMQMMMHCLMQMKCRKRSMRKPFPALGESPEPHENDPSLKRIMWMRQVDACNVWLFTYTLPDGFSFCTCQKITSTHVTMAGHCNQEEAGCGRTDRRLTELCQAAQFPV